MDGKVVEGWYDVIVFLGKIVYGNVRIYFMMKFIFVEMNFIYMVVVGGLEKFYVVFNIYFFCCKGCEIIMY